MIHHLFTRFRIHKARKARRAAFLAFRDAVDRGDTRDQHTTRRALYRAQHELLAAERKAPTGYRSWPPVRGVKG